MTLDTVNQSIDYSNMLEGSPASSSDGEPATPLKTATVPAVILDDSAFTYASETGVISQVDAEGTDNGDIQDAALNSGETKDGPHKMNPQATNADKSKPKERKPTVLIIEDTTELAEVIQATLERMDIHTAHETHGTKALQTFSKLDPDVVLLDISLPDTSGWKIMDVIKERLEQTQGEMPKVIVITAYDDPANRLIGKLQGVHNYLIKPFTSDQIETQVRQALGMDSPAS
ncbi:MAG: response regulator [Chloroflexota bacterium]